MDYWSQASHHWCRFTPWYLLIEVSEWLRSWTSDHKPHTTDVGSHLDTYWLRWVSGYGHGLLITSLTPLMWVHTLIPIDWGGWVVTVMDFWPQASHHWCRFTPWYLLIEVSEWLRSWTSDHKPHTTDVGSHLDTYWLRWVSGYGHGFLITSLTPLM